MSLRMFGVLVLSLSATAGAAKASSLVMLGDAAPASTPSIVMFGAAEAGHAPIPTPSIVAFGEPMPAVTNEQVAAIPTPTKRRPNATPMVMRGGVSGGAFDSAPAETAAPAAATDGGAKAKPDAKTADASKKKPVEPTASGPGAEQTIATPQ